MIKEVQQQFGYDENFSQKVINIFESCSEIGQKGKDQVVSRYVKELNIDLARLERPLAKKIVLLELISVGYASGDYCDKERAYLRDVAGKIGVDSEKLGQIEDWVQGFISHIGSGASIVNN